jgi:hypothetical protein
MSFTIFENNAILSNRIIHLISPFNGGVLIKGLDGKPLHILRCLPSQIDAVTLALMPSIEDRKQQNRPDWSKLLSIPTPVVPSAPTKGTTPVK